MSDFKLIQILCISVWPYLCPYIKKQKNLDVAHAQQGHVNIDYIGSSNINRRQIFPFIIEIKATMKRKKKNNIYLFIFFAVDV